MQPQMTSIQPPCIWGLTPCSRNILVLSDGLSFRLKTNQTYLLMASFDDTRNQLLKWLQNMQDRLKTEEVDWAGLSEQTEHLLQEVQLQRFLNEQSERSVLREQALEERIRKLAALNTKNAPQQNAIAEQPALEFSDEIKVLPDPEGPPVPQPVQAGEPTVPAAEEMRAEADQKEAPATGWQLGLNDRIALSKNLFEGNTSDLMRVCSQLESFESIEEAREFILNIVQADYDWSEAQEHVDRLLELTEAHYQHRKR
jgi:hypothetical protein